jgi:photosystem II stability/assembly factor-like uncharacterized protein
MMPMIFNRLLLIVLGLILYTGLLQGQTDVPAAFHLDRTATGTTTASPPSNSVAHMSPWGELLWIGSSKGLARTADGGRSWESFQGDPAFTRSGIFSVSVRGDTIWTSVGYVKDVNGSSVQTGDGYAFSTDNGTSWIHRPQTVDGLGDSIVQYGSNRIAFLPVVVNEQNVTFDAAIADSQVWIASWASGVRHSSDLGQTWSRVVLPNDNLNSIAPTDSLPGYSVDPRRNNNFLAFSVYLQDDTTVWAGTAGGVNRSTDGGRSWKKFTTLNQLSPILGNWVIAIAGQPIAGGGTRVWITNWQADLDPQEKFGVSYTDDGGRIWRTFLEGIRVYAFAFKDSVAYAATEDGVYRTEDGGESWTRSGTIIDEVTRQRITTRTFFSVGVIGDTVYAGGSDGMVRTMDNAAHPFGASWQVLRTYRHVAAGSTYAYPNPFAPDDEAVRLHYATGGDPASVTLEIFDFGMNRVRTLIRDVQRGGGMEHDELWNGRDDENTLVANGVYFYRVIINGGEPSWGKVMVLQ